MTQIPNDLSAALTANGYNFPPAVSERLLAYLQLLEKWNQVFNLTAINEIGEMIPLHILDSLAITPFLTGKRIIDVGTGAGLPGIPLALTQPDKEFFLLDSNGKKTRFLNQVKLELGIKNIEIITARAEDFTAPAPFDSIVSRAFSSIPVMLAVTQHLVAHDGQFIAMKGTFPQQEIEQIPADFRVLEVHKLSITGLSAQRHVVCIKRL
ncbi:MAG: 16S rRNA (guanine(527)-N(7))-methyltransferase RsmG [Pseudomonadota bacterium]